MSKIPKDRAFPIRLTAEEYEILERTARRECRTLSEQVRYWMQLGRRLDEQRPSMDDLIAQNRSDPDLIDPKQSGPI